MKKKVRKIYEISGYFSEHVTYFYSRVIYFNSMYYVKSAQIQTRKNSVFVNFSQGDIFAKCKAIDLS